MSKVKTGQIIFRKIRGKIVPILTRGRNQAIYAQKRGASRLISLKKAPKPQGFVKKKTLRRKKLLQRWSKPYKDPETALIEAQNDRKQVAMLRYGSSL